MRRQQRRLPIVGAFGAPRCDRRHGRTLIQVKSIDTLPGMMVPVSRYARTPLGHPARRPTQSDPHCSPARHRLRWRRGGDGFPVCVAPEDLSAQRVWCLRQLALGHGVPDATGVLRAAVAGVGPAPGRAVRPGCAALLHFWPGAVSAGLHLPDGHSGDLGAVAVPVHCRCRPPVVRVCLPADGLHRDLSLDREKDGRRPLCTDAPRRGAPVLRQVLAQGWQAPAVAGRGLVDRFHLRGVLHPDPGAGTGSAERQHGLLGGVLEPVLWLRDLRQRRLHARTGVQAHVPLRPLPERDVRQGHPDRHLRHRAR